MTPARSRRVVLGTLLAIIAAAVFWGLVGFEEADAPVGAEDASVTERIDQPPPSHTGLPAAVRPPHADPAAPSGAVLRGRVVDVATRRPVGSFSLTLQLKKSMRVQTPLESRTFESLDGRFEWAGLTAGQWRASLTAPGYQRFELAVSLRADEVGPELTVPLVRGRMLRGRVYDESSGVGVAGARISFRESHVGRFEVNWRSREDAVSRQDGFFELQGLPLGDATLQVTAKGYAARELDAPASNGAATMDIALGLGGVISGYLAAEDGVTPVAGTAGLMYLDEGHGSSYPTGDAGQFAFSSLPAGRYLVSGERQGVRAVHQVELQHNERVEGLVLKVGGGPRGQSIWGTVLGLRPEDLKRAYVSVHPGGYGSRVDESGAYAVHGVPPGRVQMQVDVYMGRTLRRTLEMPADRDLNVDLTFPPGARLSGRITRAGAPLVDEWVEPRARDSGDVDNRGAPTSSEGRYVIQDVPLGEYAILVAGFLTKPIHISGDTVFDVDVPAAQVSGRVLESDGQTPIAMANVHMVRRGTKLRTAPLHSRTDHFGDFRLIGLEPGEFVLSIYKPGYEMYREQISYVAPAGKKTVALGRDHGVQVRVRDPQSALPLRHLVVSEQIDGSRVFDVLVRLNDAGIGHIPGALAGGRLSIFVSGYAPIDIARWDGQPLDLTLRSDPHGSEVDRDVQTSP